VLNQPLENLVQLVFHNRLQIFPSQRTEHNHPIQTVKKLRTEITLDFLVEQLFHLLIVGLLGPLPEAETGLVLNQIGSDIARHNQDHVLEINMPSERIRQTPFFHNLQKHIIHIGMGLFDLIQQKHRIRPTPYPLRQLPALFIPNIPRGRTNQTAYIMLLHILAHVNLNERIRISKHKLRQSTRQKSLSNPARTNKDETPHRTIRVFQTASAATDGLRNRTDRLILRNHRFMQLRFQFKQFLRFFFLQPCQRNTRHLAHHFGHHIHIHNADLVIVLLLPLTLDFRFLVQNPLNIISKSRRTLIICIANGLIFFRLEFLNFRLILRQIRRRRHILQTHPRSRLINHINGLIRQTPAGNIPAGQFNRLIKGLIRKANAMVLFITIPKTLQNLEGLFFARRLNNNRLEPPLQGSIFFHIFPILVKGRRTDAVNFTPSQSRLENIGRINCAFCSAGTNKRMKLINKENHIPRTPNFIDDGLDALLKLPAIFRTGHHHRQIQHDQPLITKNLRHFMRGNPLSQTLDNSGLANARLTKQHRVIFRTPAKNLNQTLNLRLTPNHRVQLILRSQLRKVAAKTIQGRSFALGPHRGLSRRRHRRIYLHLHRRITVILHPRPKQIQHFLTNILKLKTKIHQNLSRNPFRLPEQTQKNMLRPHIVMV